MTDGNAGNTAAPPAAALTIPTLVAGGSVQDALDYYRLPVNTPVASSLKFIEFEVTAQHAQVDRATLLGAILMLTWPAPNSSQGANDLTMLHTLHFLENEFKAAALKRLLHELHLCLGCIRHHLPHGG